MSEINGFDNEFLFVKYLNGKKIRELNPMMYELIKSLFPYDSEDSVIKAWKNHYKQKSDIFVKVNGTMKGISIKKGIKNSVHTEGISSFIHFLIENKVPREIVIEYLKYQYVDGTTNGKGQFRQSIEQYKQENQDKIDKINEVLNNEKILRNAILRFVTKGNNSNYQIDAIVHGEANNFIWATTNEISEIILSKKNSYSTSVHFGPMICQPKTRCLNYNPLYEKDRFIVQIKWYSLYDDIVYYRNDNLIKQR